MKSLSTWPEASVMIGTFSLLKVFKMRTFCDKAVVVVDSVVVVPMTEKQDPLLIFQNGSDEKQDTAYLVVDFFSRCLVETYFLW